MKKRSKSKEAKFFCESCGSEVPRNSKTCPVCGKFFASVRCPQCGRIGDNDDFKNGCPTCGYAINPDSLNVVHAAVFLALQQPEEDLELQVRVVLEVPEDY